MPVYFAQAGDAGPVKIGVSADRSLIARLQTLQTSNHVRLKLLRVVAGGKDVEQKIHERFCANRMHGEWFSYDRAMEGNLGFPEWTAIPNVQDVFNPRSKAELSQAISGWMKRTWADPDWRAARAKSIRVSKETRARQASAANGAAA
jgi:T5orf172 domain